MDELCGDYQRGRCLRGSACRYRHVGDIPQRAPGDIEGEEKEMFCRDYQRGRCVRGENCRFKHVGEIEQQAPPPTGIFDDTGRVINLPPRGVFAPAPQQAIDLRQRDPALEDEGPSNMPSQILGLSELDICKMSADELIIHIEKKIMQRQAEERAHDSRGMGAADVRTSEEDLPPMPPLPAPTLPDSYYGVPTAEVHSTVTELVLAYEREGKDAVEDVVREAAHDDLAAAMFRVLQESGALRNPQGVVQALPPAAAPELPAGHKSWVLHETAEEKASRLRRDRENRMNAHKRKQQREEEYRRWQRDERVRRKREERQRQQLARAKEALNSDPAIDPVLKESIEQELGEINAEEIDDILALGDAELEGLDDEAKRRVRMMQQLLSGGTE
eukprot:TRINITY_DN35930_c0_g1_i1.p1 TRINITY_DN35930_c0_g1~~TRINITY_DN35930_c0_g1_i1.p1  ORF type:complete len:388 (+),score=166.78 TRINITY_DN35930_c0_g1_i1:54-1217(+)